MKNIDRPIKEDEDILSFSPPYVTAMGNLLSETSKRFVKKCSNRKNNTNIYDTFSAPSKIFVAIISIGLRDSQMANIESTFSGKLNISLSQNLYGRSHGRS